MHKQPRVLFAFLSLFVCIFNSAYACSPSPDEKPAGIAKQAQDSRYVFDGVVTEITDTYVKVKVAQYFKGEGFGEIKIAQNKGQENSCTDDFILEQRAIFFTKGDMEGVLEPVYDGSFGSVRTMNADTFSEITAITECMGTFQNGNLTVPCLIHQETQKYYQAALAATTNSSGGLMFSVADVSNLKPGAGATECMATYKSGQLSVPCIAHKDSQKVYLANLIPDDSTGFLVNYVSTVSNVKYVTHFDKGRVGTVPDGWEQGITGGGISEWKLEKDNTAPSSPLVLKQSAYGDFPWCIQKDSKQSDGFVAVKFKAISGSVDQAAGLIWRWKDAYNYYVARANALENNVSIYYMQDGERYTIRYVDIPNDQAVKKNVWQALRVDFQGDQFIVSFEGKPIVNVRDSHIKGEGAVGLWTKEDSVTSFDDFSYGD